MPARRPTYNGKDETANGNLQIRVAGDCATESDLPALLRNDTNLRQALDDMT